MYLHVRPLTLAYSQSLAGTCTIFSPLEPQLEFEARATSELVGQFILSYSRIADAG